jgi:MFS family permease
VFAQAPGAPEQLGTELGYVFAAGIVPQVLFMLGGGVIADRFGWRPTMLTADAARCAAQALLAVDMLATRPSAWVFAMFAAVRGAGDAFFTPALGGLVAGAGSALAGAFDTTAEQPQLPPAALARVTAIQTVSAFALGPLSFAAAGPVAGVLGASAVLGFGAVWCTLSTAVVLALPAVRRGGRDRPARAPLGSGPAGGQPRARRGLAGPAYLPAAGTDRLPGPASACRARKAAALTRFWQDVEQNRRVPLREAST